MTYAAKSRSHEALFAELRALTTRAEIALEEVPAPQKLAPFALAFSADVSDVAADTEDDDPTATGRFVLLHDPEGQDGWSGQFRCVTYVRSAIDPEMASDPLLCEIGWSWLMEALKEFNCGYGSESGTVTRVASATFGMLAEREGDSEIEIRASWTPLNVDSLTGHLSAWLRLLEIAAGLAPVPPGVTQLHRH